MKNIVNSFTKMGGHSTPTRTELFLEQCKKYDPRYQEFRDRHYVENHGCIGRQVHYLIWYDTLGKCNSEQKASNKLIGIISGGSPVWLCKPRDDFFGIDNKKLRGHPKKRSNVVNAIVDNNVFRIESNYSNLASRILYVWRCLVKKFWKEKYGVEVIGFETFVDGNNTRTGEKRKGTCYLADNWSYVGMTKGGTKNLTIIHGRGYKSGCPTNNFFSKRRDSKGYQIDRKDRYQATRTLSSKLIFVRRVEGSSSNPILDSKMKFPSLKTEGRTANVQKDKVTIRS